jgi:hypothetical protein
MKSTVLRAMFEEDGTAPIVEDVRWSEDVCSKCVEGVWRERFIYAVSEGTDPHSEWTKIFVESCIIFVSVGLRDGILWFSHNWNRLRDVPQGAITRDFEGGLCRPIAQIILFLQSILATKPLIGPTRSPP